MTIYIVRHGETEENRQRILQGHLPGQLTDKGEEQICNTANWLAEQNIPFHHIVSSDLKRAVDSSRIIADKLHLSIETMVELRERDWGKYTGISIAEARQKYRLNGIWHFPDSVETEEAIILRAKKALKLLKEKYQNDNLLIVTHGLFARILIAAHFDCSYKEVNPFINGEVRPLEI